MREEVEEELEVLRAIYGDEQVQLLTDPSAEEVRIEIDLQPRVEQSSALVSVTLAIALPSGYPADALPKVSVERSRGLGDVALRSLVAVAERACQEHGLQEVGCVSQVLGEVSEALDEANDSQVECNICLASCSPGEDRLGALRQWVLTAVHPPCDHIFHARCIGHWAKLKAEEAEASALEADASTISARDGLRREVEDSVNREAEAMLRASNARERSATCARLVEIVRLRREGGDRAEDLVVSAEHEALLVNEEGEEIPLDTFVEQARSAKAEEKRLLTEERSAQKRLADEQRRLEELDAELETKAALRTSAPLPCPVCRKPIDRSLLCLPCREAPKTEESSAKQSTSQASVAGLPDELRKQVYSLQARQRAILESRLRREEVSQKEAEADREASSSSNAIAQRVAAGTLQVEPPRDQRKPVEDTSGKNGSKGYGDSATLSDRSNGTNKVAYTSSWNASNWDCSQWSETWWEEGGSQGTNWKGSSRHSAGSTYESGGKGSNRNGRWRK